MTVYDFAGDSTTTLGIGWTARQGTWGKQAGQAYSVTATDGDHATRDTGQLNHRVGVKLWGGAAQYPGLVLSYTDASNFAWAELQPDAGVLFRKKVAGVNSDLAYPILAGIWVAGDTLEAEKVNGNQFHFYRNGVLAASSDTAQTDLSGTHAGIRYGESGYGDPQRWDDFTIEDGAQSNQSPTANAGVDLTGVVGQVVTLVGSGSDPDGTIASYAWTLPTRPSGSAAALVGSGATRTFTPDVAGVYVASLVVTDDGGLTSAADTVAVTVATVVGPTILRWEGGTWVRRKLSRRTASAWVWA